MGKEYNDHDERTVMGKGPDKQDYEATDAEKASASVAVAENNYFKKKYAPLLREMRDESLKVNTKATLRGRANADTMQALSDADYNRTTRVGSSSDLAKATQGQLSLASSRAKDVKDRMQTSVLGTARGQAADAQTGMAKASRLATSEALNRAKNNEAVAQSKFQAATQLGTSFLLQGGENMGSGEGGTFLQGVDKKGNPVSRMASVREFIDG